MGPLKTILLHRPSRELEQLIPTYLDEMLFEDIPCLAQMQEEHDMFADTLREEGAGRRSFRRGSAASCETKSFIPSETLEIETTEKTETDPEEDPEHPIICAYCGTLISYKEYILRYGGSSEHIFTNPHGLLFRVGLLQKAPGLLSVGEWTEEFSWFAGFAWRFSLCGGCMAHLGWEYLGAPGGGPGEPEGNTEFSRFYGLVVTKLSGWE